MGNIAGAAPDPDAARRAARQILSRPEFQVAPQSPIDRLRHWVAQQIAHALEAALSGRATVLGVVLLVIIALVFAYLLRRFTRSLQRDPRVEGVAVAFERRSSADWLAEAATCEARGDWKGVLRARYRGLVAELASRRLLDEAPGRTTGEYRALVRRSIPGAAEPFGTATDLFEAAVYGHRPTGASEGHELADLADRVLANAR